MKKRPAGQVFAIWEAGEDWDDAERFGGLETGNNQREATA
jgi:hypothetical protein